MTPYHAQKIAWHPTILDRLRHGDPTGPITVEWILTNVCNQACSFCSYGAGPPAVREKVPNPPAEYWRNQQQFSGKAMFPFDRAAGVLRDLRMLGTKSILLTGGGEPTTYPQFLPLVQMIAAQGFECALTTNGVLLNAETVACLGHLPFTWVRVSLDAGTPEDYVQTRSVPSGHWVKAWHAVELLAREREQLYAHPESRVGVGFVVDRDNWRHLYEACRIAKEAGADNLRVAMALTSERLLRFGEACLASIPEQLERVRVDLVDETFEVNDLVLDRLDNLQHPHQQYPYCYWKDIGCVIGADQKVYSCCSLTYNALGEMFSIQGQSFLEGWTGVGQRWRRVHDPRHDCRVWCRYEQRNMEALRLMLAREEAAALASQPPPLHRNFV